MSDEFDRAQEQEQLDRDMAIAHARRAVKANNLSGICLACGDEIGQARFNALPGCAHCIECACLIESKRQWKGRP